MISKRFLQLSAPLLIVAVVAGCGKSENETPRPVSSEKTAKVEAAALPATEAKLEAASGVVETGPMLLARKNNCTACHAIDKKIVGPAWMDVSKKYKGQNVEAKLITKVSKGGAGVWSTMPMPANDAAGIKQAEIKELVQFILGLAK